MLRLTDKIERIGLKTGLAVALLSAACTAFIGSAVASADASLELGFQDDSVLVHSNSILSRDQGLDYMSEMKVKSIRINSTWHALLTTDPNSKKAPKTPTYDFSKLDAAIDAANARGFKVQLTVFGLAPAWATGNKKVGTYKINPKHYGRFAKDLAKQFKGRVQTYSIWNEPNWPTLIQPQRSCNKPKCKPVAPKIYRKMYIAAYKSIKSVSKKNKVLIGETTSVGNRRTSKGYSIAPLEFFRIMLCVDPKMKKRSCNGLKTDGIAHHPYFLDGAPEKRPPTLDDVTMGTMFRMVSAAKKFRKLGALNLPNSKSKSIPIYGTEMAYLTASARGVSNQQQANYYKRTIQLLKKTPTVKQIVFYTLIDYETESSWGSAGVLTKTGDKKPAFETLKSLF